MGRVKFPDGRKDRDEEALVSSDTGPACFLNRKQRHSRYRGQRHQPAARGRIAGCRVGTAIVHLRQVYAEGPVGERKGTRTTSALCGSDPCLSTACHSELDPLFTRGNIPPEAR